MLEGFDKKVDHLGKCRCIDNIREGHPSKGAPGGMHHVAKIFCREPSVGILSVSDGKRERGR